MIDLTNLADLRIALVETRAQLRDAEQRLSVTRAIAEAAAIASAVEAYERATGKKVLQPSKVMGDNEAERERNMILALDDDGEYQRMRSVTFSLQKEVELLSAAIANREDELRERNRQTRQALVDLLAGRNLDDALAEASERRLVRVATFGEQ